MTIDFSPLALILFFPALGVVFNLFYGRKAGRGAVNFVGTSVIFLAFAIALWAFAKLLMMPPGGALAFTLWPWISAGNFHVDIALRFDALSAVMTLVVSGVGAFIHLYSCGYMAHDEDYARYFAYMNLFALAMLVLVLADNLLLMFVGWEGVGLCSYLLIAFWYSNSEFAYNGRKAFITNRVGDAAAALLLFLGATGKSAQVPLYVWLPDAMVGPTPVSALIHAATMVTAGVYMIARLNFLYRLGPDAMQVVAIIGALTSFFAATVAIVQSDIKRVLAYSTISQIGYMVVGVGVGAFAAGIFHLMTHAFFKGLLFLCAGSIMHALEGEQDMNRMGGLRRKLPITYTTMLIAALAISGIPFFAGYFSKDLILESTYTSGHIWLWLLGLVTAGLTSFYMFRLIFVTFHGESRVASEKEHHIHESPPVMTIPLIVLAVVSIIGGWVELPEGMIWGGAFSRFLAPLVAGPVTGLMARPAAMAGSNLSPSLVLSAVATLTAIIGIGIAWIFYIQVPALAGQFAESMRALYDVLRRKYYIDELYNLIVTRPLFFISTYVLYRGVDVKVIDGIVDGLGLRVEESGEAVRKVESGNVQDYAFVYLLGALAVAAYYVYLVIR